MNIGFASAHGIAELGGAQIFLDRLVTALQERGHTVAVIAPVLSREGFNPSYPIIQAPRPRSLKHFAGGGVPFILKGHRQYKFDVLHCHGEYYAAWSGYWYNRLTRVPYICKTTGEGFRATDPFLKLRRRLRTALENSESVIANGEYMRQEIIKHGIAGEKIAVIHNGVRSEDYDKSKAGKPPVSPPYVLYAGGLRKEKGYEVMLQGFSRIAAKFPSCTLVMIGSDTNQARFKETVHDFRLDKQVQFLGYCDPETKMSLFCNATVYAAPYHQAPFSNANLEAMAASVPIVASAVESNKEQITDGKEGYLISPDDPVNLADKISMLLIDDELRKRMGEQARKRAEFYAWDAMLESYEEQYALAAGRS